MSQDSNFPGAYTINTSALPVYVMPPQTGQVNYMPPQSFVTYAQPPSYEQQSYYPTNQANYSTPSSYYPPSPTPPPYYETQVNLDATQKLEASILERAIHAPRITGAISEAFSIFGKHCCFYLPWLFACFLAFGVYIGVVFFFAINTSKNGAVLAVFFIGVAAVVFYTLALIPGITGIYYATLQLIRSENSAPTVSHFFYGFFPVVWMSQILLGFIVSVFTTVGFFLFIVPGIYFSICFMLSPLIYLEYHKQGITVGQCLSISHAVIRKNFFSWFAFQFLSSLVVFIPFCFPVVLIAHVVVFRDSIGLIENHDPASFSISNKL